MVYYIHLAAMNLPVLLSVYIQLECTVQDNQVNVIHHNKLAMTYRGMSHIGVTYISFVYYWEIFYSNIVFLSIEAHHIQVLLNKFYLLKPGISLS
jgi:hypothetical protein